VLKLLAFVLRLGLDSFAVAAAIGASQMTTAWQRLRISLAATSSPGNSLPPRAVTC
jgi:putative Mn2+ efflux pump MntP